MEKITSFTIDHIKLTPGLYTIRKFPEPVQKTAETFWI